jgi:hypothetical protein
MLTKSGAKAVWDHITIPGACDSVRGAGGVGQMEMELGWNTLGKVAEIEERLIRMESTLDRILILLNPSPGPAMSPDEVAAVPQK